jgi:photosystem I subunit 10
MIHSSLLFTLAAVPSTVQWSPKVAAIMITCNLFAIAIGFYAIPSKNRGKGPDIPVQLPGLFSGFGITELLATASFGHVLGAGMILGLANAGLL